MPSELFRRHAHELVDWMAAYLEDVEDLPVLARVKPGKVRSSLSSGVPEEADSFEELFETFRSEILPGVTHWNHPGFLGYFPVTGSGPGILGEMLAAALNVNAMVWRSSPAGTEVEETAVDSLRTLLGLPSPFDGVINDTASHSSLYALAAAREANLPEAWEEGMAGAPRARVYASREAHSSIEKAAVTLGLGRRGVARIPTDGAFRMDAGLLRRAVEKDLESGVRPLAVVATIGTTSTTSVDPVREIWEVAREENLWLHVDAAYAGPAASVPELRHHFRGWEGADSIVVNPHKWLFTPIDCSVLFCRRPDMLRGAFSLTPEYLRTPEEGEARNLMDYGVALGRRFRGLKLWLVLRYFGARGIRERLRTHVRLARMVAGWIDDDPSWERAAPVPFSTVVFRYAPDGIPPEELDSMNRRILDRVNRSGEVFLTHTELGGRIWLRISVGNLRTRESHVRKAWRSLQEAAGSL